MGSGGHILVLNAGSSSIKVDALNSGNLDVFWRLSMTGIGQGETRVRVNSTELETSNLDYHGAVELLEKTLRDQMPDTPLVVGHRFVHGGLTFSGATAITDEVTADLQTMTTIDPGHTPQALRLVSLIRDVYGGVLQVACFDTAFYTDLPEVSRRLPIARRFHDKGLMRYGFHGLSYMSLLDTFRRVCGDKAASGRVILAHLGSGVSVTACVGGMPVDTTMAYSPSSGVMMSTRSGDIDPAVVIEMMSGSDSVLEELTEKSGLLGVSGVSGDMYDVLQAESSNENARLAVDMFCHQLKKVIAGFAARMGGVDSIIFAGGMGENAPDIRRRILSGMEFMGVTLDEEKNLRADECISADDSHVGVHVLHTDENRVIAAQSIQKYNESVQEIRN